MLISVVVITYNHEKYIAKALESILNQKGEFEIEILVGDDSSVDSTPDIIREYIDKYPNIIKADLREKNIGATRNSYELFMKARGEYIAILEGDDYWKDECKLKKQLEFMTKNPTYAGCCCEFEYVDDCDRPLLKSRDKALRGDLYFSGNIYSIKEINNSMLPSHAGTMFFKNFFRKGKKADIIYKAHNIIGDFTIVMLILSDGLIYKMNDIMSCYRFIEKGGGSWSTRAAENPYHFYEIFMYHTALENYASKDLNMKIDLRRTKEMSFYRMCEAYFNNKVKARKQCISEMLRKTQNKFRYIKIMMLGKLLYKVPGSIKSMVVEGKDLAVAKSLDKTWKDFYARTRGKKIILYGAGGGCKEFENEYYYEIPIEYVVDGDITKQGGFQGPYRICNVEKILSYDEKEIAVIITTGLYGNEIAENLLKMGIKEIYSYPLMESRKLRYKIAKKIIRNKNYMR